MDDKELFRRVALIAGEISADRHAAGDAHTAALLGIIAGIQLTEAGYLKSTPLLMADVGDSVQDLIDTLTDHDAAAQAHVEGSGK